jgi:hypothetical protein
MEALSDVSIDSLEHDEPLWLNVNIIAENEKRVNIYVAIELIRVIIRLHASYKPDLTLGLANHP